MRKMILRQRKEKDESLLEELNQCKEVLRFIKGGLTKPWEKLPEKPCKNIIEKVIETDGGVSAGIVAIFKSDVLDNAHELLCAILPHHRKHELATRACRQMLKEVSDDQSVDRVIGCVARKNTSSLALIDKLWSTFLQPREDFLGDQEDIYVFKLADRPTKRL